MHDEDYPHDDTGPQIESRYLHLPQEEAKALYLEWSKKSYWTPEEAAALIRGTHPDVLTPRENLPIKVRGEIERICDLLRRKFGERVPPPELLDWAEQVDEKIPAALMSAIQSRDPGAKRIPRQSDETRVRETLLKIIIGMATEKYGYVPKKKNAAAKHISSILEEMELGVSEQTVYKYLTEAAQDFDGEIGRWLSR